MNRYLKFKVLFYWTNPLHFFSLKYISNLITSLNGCPLKLQEKKRTDVGLLIQMINDNAIF